MAKHKKKKIKNDNSRYERFKMHEYEFQQYLKERRDFKIYKENAEEFKKYLYNKIWIAFIESEKEFYNYMGYGEEKIEAIGIAKFIDKMGWSNPSQVTSWKTDRAHIVPCIECDDDFGIFEMDYGLCNSCKQKYDLSKIQSFLEASFHAGDKEKYLLDVAMITQDKSVRANFLKEAK